MRFENGVASDSYWRHVLQYILIVYWKQCSDIFHCVQFEALGFWGFRTTLWFNMFLHLGHACCIRVWLYGSHLEFAYTLLCFGDGTLA